MQCLLLSLLYALLYLHSSDLHECDFELLPPSVAVSLPLSLSCFPFHILFFSLPCPISLQPLQFYLSLFPLSTIPILCPLSLTSSRNLILFLLNSPHALSLFLAFSILFFRTCASLSLEIPSWPSSLLRLHLALPHSLFPAPSCSLQLSFPLLTLILRHPLSRVFSLPGTLPHSFKLRLQSCPSALLHFSLLSLLLSLDDLFRLVSLYKLSFPSSQSCLFLEVFLHFDLTYFFNSLSSALSKFLSLAQPLSWQNLYLLALI